MLRFYFDVGVGLGLGKGTWASDCGKIIHEAYTFHSYQTCEISDGIRFGVPMHASAVFGKYFGVGITVEAFLTNENSHAGIMITLPFGDFTN